MTERRIRAEFHCHTVYSFDSILSVEALLAACKEKGLDKVAITDHNSMQGALRAKEIDPERIILAEEIQTDEGEILGYYMQEEVPPHLSPMQVIERLKKQGALISLAHPFDRMRSAWTPQTLHEILPHLDALEVFNARCLSQTYNKAAAEFAATHQLLPMAGSDAHAAYELGQAAMELAPFNDSGSLKSALKDAHPEARPSSAAVHFSSTWAKWVKRLGGAKLSE